MYTAGVIAEMQTEGGGWKVISLQHRSLLQSRCKKDLAMPNGKASSHYDDPNSLHEKEKVNVFAKCCPEICVTSPRKVFS